MEIFAYPNVELASGELIKLELAQFDHGATHVTVGPHEYFPDLALHEQRWEIVQALLQQKMIQYNGFRYFEAQTEENERTGDLVLLHYEEVPWDVSGGKLYQDRSRYVLRHTPAEYQSIQQVTQNVGRSPHVGWGFHPEEYDYSPYFSLDP